MALWQKIGRIERYHEGARLTFKDPFGTEHLLYINREDLQRITRDRMPGDLLRVDDAGGDVTISTEGRAYRSRSGKALCIVHPCLSGADAMTPWAAFLKVLDGSQAAAPISVLLKEDPPLQAHSGTAPGIGEGLAGGF